MESLSTFVQAATPGTLSATAAPSFRNASLEHASQGHELSQSARLGLALLASGVGAACSWRTRRRQPRQAGCHALPDEDAEKDLEELEAELEALEEAMQEDADRREGELLEKVDRTLSDAPAAQTSAVVTAKGATTRGPGRVVVCGTVGENGVAQLVFSQLKEQATAKEEPAWIDLAEASRLNFEELDERMQGSSALVFCPDAADASAESLAVAKEGLKAVIASSPDELTKAVLLSHVGAQEGKGGFNIGSFFGQSTGTAWSSLEDELTSTARKRSSNRPLRTLIVRVADPPEGAMEGSVRCLQADETSDGAVTSPRVAADALFQALSFDVNTDFAVIEEPGASVAPNWGEVLLPFVGPELWRARVQDVKKAAFFVQGWAEEFFGPGKSSARLGVKTPVMIQNSASGVKFKFKPIGTGNEALFDDLDEGGLEFLVEEPSNGDARLRVIRCDYGWKVTVKENSERALLEKFQKDWAEVGER